MDVPLHFYQGQEESPLCCLAQLASFTLSQGKTCFQNKGNLLCLPVALFDMTASLVLTYCVQVFTDHLFPIHRSHLGANLIWTWLRDLNNRIYIQLTCLHKACQEEGR